mgnify:CR=1 FL=1
MKRLLNSIFGLALFLLATSPAAAYRALDAPDGTGPVADASGRITSTFTLDGVTVELETALLSDLDPVVSEPSSAIQMATAVERRPAFRQLSVTVAPFGVSPPTEGLPPAAPGGAQGYRAALVALREAQGGGPVEGPRITMFGDAVVGSTSVVTLPVQGIATATAITEFVTEAGQRLWILRAVQELDAQSATSSVAGLSAPLVGTRLASPDVSQPSASLIASQVGSAAPRELTSLGTPSSDLPEPAWWDGDCDTDFFFSQTGHTAYPLGAVYRGMKACGPRPSAWPYVQARVDFGAGYPQLEWQCPEISKRFLYLAYGIPPYPGNGNEVVENYDGDLLEKVWNCTIGRAPQPDDVMSYGQYTAYGHTAVVVQSDVNAAGNGTIGVIEQNSSANGYRTHTVSGWCVETYTDVIGWLHNPGDLSEWLVAYYADQALSEPCANQGLGETYLFQHWGDDAPAAGCPADGFSARFSRAIDFPGGEYSFALGYEGGARLRVGGEIVIDGWGAPEQHHGTLDLPAGQYQVEVEYRHGAEDAALAAFWWGPGFELTREARDSSLWYAEYWPNQDLWWDPVVMTQDGSGALDHRWTDETPSHPIPSDHFSSRFQRTVTLAPGRWRFEIESDDGARFFIDDCLILDQWQDQVALFTPIVTLLSGDHDFKMEHYENEGYATIALDWERISDATASTGWVTSPPNGTAIKSCPLVIHAQVGGGVGPVDRVEFFVHHDGEWHTLGGDWTSPYAQTWECGIVAEQPVAFIVHVWDDAGRHFVDPNQTVVAHLTHQHTHRLPLILKAWSGNP